MTDIIQRNIVSFMTGNVVFQARLLGNDHFDRMLSMHLMECRLPNGRAFRGVSYYERVRHDRCVLQDTDDRIDIQYNDNIRITIMKHPFVGGMMTFPDREGRFRPTTQDEMDDFYAYMMEKFNCPVDLDDGHWRDGLVHIRWDHNHFMDMRYDYGYIVPRRPHDQFLWEYTLTGPAQVYREALEMIEYFDL